MINRHTRMIVLSVFPFFLVSSSFAQNISILPTQPEEEVHDFHFSYDADGNRVKKLYSNDSQQLKNMNENRNNTAKTTDGNSRLRNYEVSIYPNPTTEIVNIDISGMVNTDRLHIDIYNIDGKHLFSSDMDTNVLKINLGNSPSGLYIFAISIGEEILSYKVVKTNK